MAMKCIDFISLPTITQIELSFRWVNGNPMTKFMGTESHFH